MWNLKIAISIFKDQEDIDDIEEEEDDSDVIPVRFAVLKNKTHTCAMSGHLEKLRQ